MFKWKALAALVVVVVGCVAIYWRHRLTNVQLHLGEKMSVVLRSNDLPWFDPTKQDDFSTIIWPHRDDSGELFSFTYDDSSGPIKLPPARLIWMQEYSGIVTSIRVTASPAKQSLDEFSAAVGEVAKHFRASGWKQVVAPPSAESLRSAMAGTNGSMSDVTVASFVKGEVTASLSLSVPGGTLKPELAARSEFVLEVSFNNQSLADSESKKTYMERMTKHGNIGDPFPLSYWMEKQ